MGRDDLLQNLKALKRTLDPDPEFLHRSRDLILTSRQKSPYIFQTRNILSDGLKWSLALGLTSLLLFIIVGGFNPSNKNFLASLNEKALLKESGRVTFNIELDEIRYRQQLEKNIAVVIDEIISN